MYKVKWRRYRTFFGINNMELIKGDDMKLKDDDVIRKTDVFHFEDFPSDVASRWPEHIGRTVREAKNPKGMLWGSPLTKVTRPKGFDPNTGFYKPGSDQIGVVTHDPLKPKGGKKMDEYDEMCKDCGKTYGAHSGVRCPKEGGVFSGDSQFRPKGEKKMEKNKEYPKKFYAQRCMTNDDPTDLRINIDPESLDMDHPMLEITRTKKGYQARLVQLTAKTVITSSEVTKSVKKVK